MATRWGFIGTGRIANDFIVSMKTLPQEDHKVVGVVDLDYNVTRAFADKHGIPKVYKSFEDLAQDPDVEIAYVAVLNPYHAKLCELMLNYGKHVVCEKPLTTNVQDSRKILQMAKEKNLFLFEGIWSRCFPTYVQLRKELEAKSVGEVQSVTCTFGRNLLDFDRITKKNEGGSATLDIGVYALQFIILVFGLQKPLKVIATGFLNEQGVDEKFGVTILYPNQKTAYIICDITCEMKNDAYVYGTQGYLTMCAPFWCGKEFEALDKKYAYELPDCSECCYLNSTGLRYEQMEVRRCLLQGLKESPLLTHAESELLSELKSEILHQLGVNFEPQLK